jgi:hypothetical protein
MIDPTIINVICPNCKGTWMNLLECNRAYFCFECGHTLTKEQAKQEAWKSESPYYGE